MSKGYENENILSVLCISSKIDNAIYTSIVPILGIAK